MAIWPFNRKKNDNQDLPPEVQDYYQAERREKVGVAGLLALGTLLVTILVAIGLFFGGRWVYRTVFDKDRPNTAAVQNENKAEEEVEQRQEDEQKEKQEAEEAEKARVEAEKREAEAAAERTRQEAARREAEARNNAANQPAPAPAPATGKASDLPSTGPADTIAIFLGTVVIGTSLYYLARQPN